MNKEKYDLLLRQLTLNTDLLLKLMEHCKSPEYKEDAEKVIMGIGFFLDMMIHDIQEYRKNSKENKE